VLVVAAGLGYQWLVHLAAVGSLSPAWRLGLKFVPLLAFAGWIAARARHKAWWSIGLVGVAALIWWLDGQTQGSAIAYGLPHAAVYIFLFCLFARTLAPGREPLVTGLAQRMHMSLTPPMAAYTRGVTIAWCWFFLAQLAVSALLFRYASVEAWSLFITVLHFPLVILMFALENVYRCWSHPDHPRTSVATAMGSFFNSDEVVGDNQVSQ
jgi:uncharacterized membrane protein